MILLRGLGGVAGGLVVFGLGHLIDGIVIPADMQPDAWRMFVVAAEQKTFVVAAEGSKTTVVAAEAKTFSIPAEDRTITGIGDA